MKIGALTLLQKMHSNGKKIDDILIAAWHWPSSITWRWSITRQKVESKRKMPMFRFIRTHRGRGWNFQMCFYSRITGVLQLSTQPNMWRTKRAGVRPTKPWDQD